MIAAAQFYYVASFFLTVSVESLLEVAEHAVEHNKVFAMNLSAPFLIQFFQDQMKQVRVSRDYAKESENMMRKASLFVCFAAIAPHALFPQQQTHPQAIPYADYVFANESEAAAYGELKVSQSREEEQGKGQERIEGGTCLIVSSQRAFHPNLSSQGWGTDIPTIALRLAAEPKKSGTRARVVVFTQVSEATRSGGTEGFAFLCPWGLI